MTQKRVFLAIILRIFEDCFEQEDKEPKTGGDKILKGWDHPVFYIKIRRVLQKNSYLKIFFEKSEADN